jgi:hypothetical protein
MKAMKDRILIKCDNRVSFVPWSGKNE